MAERDPNLPSEDLLRAEGMRKALGVPGGALDDPSLPPSKLPKTAPYPKDFVQLYNSAQDGMARAQKPGERDFFAQHLSALNAQKDVYDYVNRQGLKNLPQSVQQHIATQPQFEEWDQQPSGRLPTAEPPQPQNPDIPNLASRAAGAAYPFRGNI